MKILNKQKLKEHFKQNRTHSIFLSIYDAQIQCNSCEYEVCDNLKFGKTIEDNYMFKIRQLILKETIKSNLNQDNEFSNLRFMKNQNNSLLTSVLLFSQLKQINNIFDKPLLRTDMTGFHQKIHSSFITSISRLFSNIQKNSDVSVDFQKFYFSLLKKSQKYGSYQPMNLQDCFLDLIQMSHQELKKKISNVQQPPRDSIFELKDIQKIKQQEISELSTNFTGKIKIEKSCSQCCNSNYFIQDFFQIKFQKIQKSDKNIILQNRNQYAEHIQQEDQSFIKKVWNNCQRFKVTIFDLIYIFLNQQETAKNSKNTFDFYDKLSDRFNFLENQYQKKEDFPNFCQQCFNDLSISYSLVDLPNILIFSAQNIKQYNLEIKKELDLSLFRGLNQKNNQYEFSTQTLNNIQSLKDLQKQTDDYVYDLQSFVTEDNSKIFTYFKNKDDIWHKVNQNSIQKIENKEVEKIIQKLKSLNLCVYQKKIVQQEKLNDNINNDEKPSFVPRLLIQSLKEKKQDSKMIFDSFFCDHLKLRTSYREIFGKYHINQYIQSKDQQDQKVLDLIEKIKHKNTTLLNYISESEILTIREIKQMFQKNNLLINYKIFQNPQQCNDCHKLLIMDQIKKVILKVILCAVQQNESQKYAQHYIEKEWLQNFFEYLNSNKNLPKNSSISAQKNFENKINTNFDQFKHTPYYNRFLINVSENCLAVLLDIYGGQIIYSKSFCQSIRSVDFEIRQKTLDPNLELLIRIIKSKQFQWCFSNKKVIQKFIKIEQKVDILLELKFPKMYSSYFNKQNDFQTKLKSIYNQDDSENTIIQDVLDNIPRETLDKISLQQEQDSLMHLFSVDESNEQELYQDSNEKFIQTNYRKKVNFFSQRPNHYNRQSKGINSFLIGDDKTERVSVDKIDLEIESKEDLSEENYGLNISQAQDKYQYSNSKELRLLCGQIQQTKCEQNVLITIEQSAEQQNQINKVIEQLNLSFSINPLKQNQIQKFSQFGFQNGIVITNELSTERSALTKKSYWKEQFFPIDSQKVNKKLAKLNTKMLLKKTKLLKEKIDIFAPNCRNLKRKDSYLLIVQSNQKPKRFTECQKQTHQLIQENQNPFGFYSEKKNSNKKNLYNQENTTKINRQILQSIDLNM